MFGNEDLLRDKYAAIKYAGVSREVMDRGTRARPVNAFVLSLLGSLFIILGAILSVVLSSGVFYISSSVALAFTAVSGALDVVMLLASIMMYERPDLHVAWGVAILVLSVASFTSALSGFAGLGLGLVGMVPSGLSVGPSGSVEPRTPRPDGSGGPVPGLSHLRATLCADVLVLSVLRSRGAACDALDAAAAARDPALAAMHPEARAR